MIGWQNLWIAQAAAETRRRELVTEAEYDRLLHMVDARRPSRMSQTLAALGGLMVIVGARLQKRSGSRPEQPQLVK